MEGKIIDCYIDRRNKAMILELEFPLDFDKAELQLKRSNPEKILGCDNNNLQDDNYLPTIQELEEELKAVFYATLAASNNKIKVLRS